ncbi:MAG: beta-N-acetylhexosaminidase [Paracoccus sp. (in: a-proteobacteria)]
MDLWLEQSWFPDGAQGFEDNGGFRFRIHNPGQDTIRPLAFCYSSATRIPVGVSVDGVRISQCFGNHHRLENAGNIDISPGGFWQIDIHALSHKPTNRSQGVMAAWLEDQDGTPIRLEPGDLQGPEDQITTPSAEPAITTATAPPIALLPWPRMMDLQETGPATALRPGEGMDMAEMASVISLHRRLFPLAPGLLNPTSGRPVDTRPNNRIQPGGFMLDFHPDRIILSHSTIQGLRHGLIALAQIIHAAQTDSRFSVPLRGQVQDAPHFGWRGLHLDVSRNFRPIDQVRRVIDIMAWHRMNRFHWHLTDDEGWRIEIPALPQLTRIGSHRGSGTQLPPQYADGPQGQSGHYSVTEARALIAHATAFGIDIIPEIDMPGHMTALLTALPHLADPDETGDSYRSIQGYPNNALNPAIPAVYDTVETILDAICKIFPSRIIHLGGDEIDANSWRQSPAAVALAKAEGFGPDDTTHNLQALFMRRIQKMLTSRGRIMGGWDECADGGGVNPTQALLFAWRSPEKTAELMKLGYDVIATPGQAYYLDMVHGDGWDSLGASWAGTAPARKTYEFSPTDGLPKDAPGQLVGVQAGIWSEYLDSVTRWNHMVFPRLSAVAETGWSMPENRNWSRFRALAPLMPKL